MDSKTEVRIKSILEAKYHPRVSDTALLVRYYQSIHGIQVESLPVSRFLNKIESGQIPTIAYILRVTRKVKEKYPHLAGDKNKRKYYGKYYSETFKKTK